MLVQKSILTDLLFTHLTLMQTLFLSRQFLEPYLNLIFSRTSVNSKDSKILLCPNPQKNYIFQDIVGSALLMSNV